MIRSRLLYAALLGAGLGFAAAPHFVPVNAAYAADESNENKVRPDVGKFLQPAQELMKQQKFKEALAKIKEAESVPNKTPYETYVMEFMRGSAAQRIGDFAVAAKAFEAVLSTGRVTGADALQMTETIGGMYSELKDYPNTITWMQRYFKEGGTDANARQTLLAAYFISGDYPNTIKEVSESIAADEKAGKAPSEQSLLILRTAQDKTGDKAGIAATTVKLLNNYPKKEYWLFVLHDVEVHLADRLAVDLERLRIATDTMGRGSPDPTAVSGQYFDMVQLLLQAGQVGEAKAISDKAFSSGILGAGGDADRQKRLRDLVNKTATEDQKSLAQGDAEAAAAKDGNGLVNQGFNYVGYGQYPKGIDMMEQGIRKGGLKHPEDAKLHLGYAYLQSGQKPKAIAMFKTVAGTDGTADLARLWVVYASK